MTNYEKFRELKIGNIQLFKNVNIENVVEILKYIPCPDCVKINDCAEYGSDCDIMLKKWLEEECIE